MSNLIVFSTTFVWLCCLGCVERNDDLGQKVRELCEEISYLNHEPRDQSKQLEQITMKKVTALEIIWNSEYFQDKTFVRSIPYGKIMSNSGTVFPVRTHSFKDVQRMFVPDRRTHHMMCCWDLGLGFSGDPVWNYILLQYC
jgi:hypothetical protein